MNILSQPIEIDRNRFDSKFRFVIAVVKRAKQLHEGSHPTKVSGAENVMSLAAEEIASGAVHVLTGVEALKAQRESRDIGLRYAVDEAGRKKMPPEVMSELEMDLMVFLEEKRYSAGTDRNIEASNTD